jgi:hypothetical protein
MHINLPDDFAQELKKFLHEHSGCFTMEALIENVISDFMESWPYDASDICVHCDECMHHKTVDAWRGERK